ncbi:MAG: flagellar hook-basal body complex protein, partial [Gemmobacter sp.]
LAEFGQAPAQDKIAQLRANVATLPVEDVPQRAADLLAEADALEPGRLQYVATQAALADALEDYEAQVAEIDTDAMADGWNLQGHKLTLRAEGALGAKLALAPAEVADTTEGAISFAGGRIWKGLGEVQGFGAVAAEIGRVVKAAQTLTGSMMEVALGFVAPRPLPADPLADPPVAPDPIDPRITREDVNGIFALAGVSMSRLAEEARKGSVEGEAPIDLILRADLVQPTGGTLARTATRLGFDETLEAPPTRDLLSALEVTTDGRIFATYGGGSATAQPEPVAQLAVAFFANPALLTQVGGGDFRRSATSGPPEVRALGEAAGTQIRSGVLEMANVDLTEELVQMLKFQQMFQSASKAMQGDVDSVAKVLEVR